MEESKSNSTLHIYTRVSSNISVKQNNSLPAQRLLGEKKARELNFDFVIHEERGKNATTETLDNRPVLQALLDKCDEKEIKHVFVTEFDRLTRHPVTQYYIKKILSDNGVLLYTTGQVFDMQDEDQSLMSDIMGLFAQRESKIKNKRVKRTLLESAKKGRSGGGVMQAYGYVKAENKMLLVEPQEAEVIKKIFTLSLQGIGTPKIAELLNKEGVPTRAKKALPNGIRVRNKYTGKETHKKELDLVWKAGTIYSILKNSIYKGDRRYKEHTIAIEPIINPEMWQLVQNNLKHNRSYSGGKKMHFYILKGLLRCSKCGRNLYGYTKEKKAQFVYMCSSKREKQFCQMKSVNITRLDNLIWDATTGLKLHIKAVLEELTNDNIRNQRLAVNEQNLLFTEKEMEELRIRMDNLVQLYLSSRIDLNKFDKHKEEIENEQQLLQSKRVQLLGEVKALRAPSTLLEAGLELEKLFFDKIVPTPEEKRKLLLSFVEEVIVDYDLTSKKHVVAIKLRVNSPMVTKELGATTKKNIKPEIDIFHGDYKTIDNILTDNKISEGTEESVYVKLFPPQVTKSHR